MGYLLDICLSFRGGGGSWCEGGGGVEGRARGGGIEVLAMGVGR